MRPDGTPHHPLLETYSTPDSGFLRFETDGMGTRNVVLVRGPDESALRRSAGEAFGLLDRLESKLSKFLPGSDVSLVNRMAVREPVAVGEELLELLTYARTAFEATGGAFDITIGSAMSAWGLVDLEGRVPSAEEIDRLSQLSMDAVEFDPDRGTVFFRRPGLAVDLGGLGKGYAADRIAAVMSAGGASAGLVSCGRSTLVTWGEPDPGEAWRFQIVDPSDGHSPWCELEAEPGALSSSGAYERSFRKDGVDFGHVLDPRLGRPANTPVRSATVWTPSALLGDVLSTTLFVDSEALQPGGAVERVCAAWPEPAERVGVLLVREDSSKWGGLATAEHHIGAAPFRVANI